MDLKINNKLWGFSGVIGRREYFLNCLFAGMIVIVLSSPMTFWFLQALINGNNKNFTNILSLILQAPLFAKVCYLLALLTGCIFKFGLVTRRTSDIFGIKQNLTVYTFTVGYIFLNILALTTGGLTRGLAALLAFIICIVLLFAKGKVSGQLPRDELKRFNWGAFWGTWIWGLINKSYKTLWILPLIAAPWIVGLTIDAAKGAALHTITCYLFFISQIICGMKGNEWAFKNTKALELEKFHKGQENQAIFWNIFAPVCIFILPLILAMVLPIIFYNTADPAKIEEIRQKHEQILENKINSFEKYEITANENKFYITPQKWVEQDHFGKIQLFNNATMFIWEKQSEADENYQKTLIDVKQATKIYSAYNNEVLAQYIIDMESIDKTDIKAVIQASMDALKLNENPKLP